MVETFGCPDIYHSGNRLQHRIYGGGEEAAARIDEKGNVHLWAGDDFLHLTPNEARYAKAALESLPLEWEDQV